jgi:hypothetical protein
MDTERAPPSRVDDKNGSALCNCCHCKPAFENN